jgi:hypothetical protein
MSCGGICAEPDGQGKRVRGEPLTRIARASRPYGQRTLAARDLGHDALTRVTTHWHHLL